jgi:hypothetical protein
MNYQLRMSGKQYQQLRAHLYNGDGNEAVALALCGKHEYQDQYNILVHKLQLISLDECFESTPLSVKWRTDSMVQLLMEAMRSGLSVLKVHSHPNGVESFSATDDRSDRDLFSSVAGWQECQLSNASAIMFSDGSVCARVVSHDGQFTPVSKILVAGDEIRCFVQDRPSDHGAFVQRHAQAFGNQTLSMLKSMKIGVVGVSGTGSIVVEQLVRLGVGRLVLVDPDKIEMKNLNRILNSRVSDVGRQKTERTQEAIAEMGLETAVESFPVNLIDPSAICAIASCDVVFGCVDGAEGRNLINRISTFYHVPYIDVGIKLEADGKGGIDQICGSVHYIQPEGSSLLSRGAITSQQIEEEAMLRTDPKLYKERLREKYIKGVDVERPAVISINSLFASWAVLELLARIHPFRDDPNSHFAHNTLSLTQNVLYPPKDDGESCPRLNKYVGRGDSNPPLGMPALTTSEN